MIQGKSGYFGTRRGFLKSIGGALAASAMPSGLPKLSPATTSSPEFPFELVPPAASGITWVHHNGRSPEMYLPETVGAGCAFLDYDNDGWMDIYLVNSGKCDFFDPNPPLRNALYRNNRDGTFTDVTEKAGVAGGGYGMGVAVGDYDGDGFPDLLRHAVRPQHSLSQQRRRHVHRRHRKAGLSQRRDGPRARSGSTTTTTAGWTCSSAGSSISTSPRTSSAATSERAMRYYCIPRVYEPMPSWLFHNNGDGTFTDVSKESGIAKSPRKSLGRGRDRHQQRRPDGSVRGQRHSGELSFSSTAATASSKRSGCRPVWLTAQNGHARSGMGVDCRRLRPGWLDGPVRRQRRPGDVLAVSQQSR